MNYRITQQNGSRMYRIEVASPNSSWHPPSVKEYPTLEEAQEALKRVVNRDYEARWEPVNSHYNPNGREPFMRLKTDSDASSFLVGFMCGTAFTIVFVMALLVWS